MKLGRPLAARVVALVAAAFVVTATPSAQAATGEDPYFRWDTGDCGNSIVISAKTSDAELEWSSNGYVQDSHGAYWFPGDNYGFPDAGDAIRLGFYGSTFQFVTYTTDDYGNFTWGPSFQNIPIVACLAPFNDVPVNHVFASHISWLSGRGITTGYDNGNGTTSFRGSQPVLREQMAAFLFRYTGPEIGDEVTPTDFADVATSHTFYDEIQWLASTGITTGYTQDGVLTFRPSQSVLREQMAAFLYRLYGSPDVDVPATSPFTDVATSHTFYREIVWLASTGVTTGYDNGNGTRSFQPSAPVLREQMAAFLNRFDNLPRS